MTRENNKSMSLKRVVNNQTITKTNNLVIASKVTDKVKEVKVVQNPYGKKSTNSGETKLPKRKKSPSSGDNQAKNRHVGWNVGNNAESNDNTAADILFKESKSGANKGEENANAKDDKEIRIRFSFKAETKRGIEQKTYVEFMRDLLYEMIQCAKIIDKKAMLKPWKSNSTLPNLNGNELTETILEDTTNKTAENVTV